MGNRAVVTVEGSKVGVYLHWNGGVESVTAFLQAAKDLGVRAQVGDTSYFYARFVQIIGNFFGGTLSVGVDELSKLDQDNGDNGVFVINEKFEIVKTLHQRRTRWWDGAYSLAVYAEVMEANRAIFAEKG